MRPGLRQEARRCGKGGGKLDLPFHLPLVIETPGGPEWLRRAGHLIFQVSVQARRATVDGDPLLCYHAVYVRTFDLPGNTCRMPITHRSRYRLGRASTPSRAIPPGDRSTQPAGCRPALPEGIPERRGGATFLHPERQPAAGPRPGARTCLRPPTGLQPRSTPGETIGYSAITMSTVSPRPPSSPGPAAGYLRRQRSRPHAARAERRIWVECAPRSSNSGSGGFAGDRCRLRQHRPRACAADHRCRHGPGHDRPPPHDGSGSRRRHHGLAPAGRFERPAGPDGGRSCLALRTVARAPDTGMARRAASVPLAKEYIDLAALGTVADVAPLTGYNRSIVRAGTRLIRSGAGPVWPRCCKRPTRYRPGHGPDHFAHDRATVERRRSALNAAAGARTADGARPAVGGRTGAGTGRRQYPAAQRSAEVSLRGIRPDRPPTRLANKPVIAAAFDTGRPESLARLHRGCRRTSAGRSSSSGGPMASSPVRRDRSRGST